MYIGNCLSTFISWCKFVYARPSSGPTLCDFVGYVVMLLLYFFMHFEQVWENKLPLGFSMKIMTFWSSMQGLFFLKMNFKHNFSGKELLFRKAWNEQC